MQSDPLARGKGPGVFASKKQGVQGEHSPRAASTGLIGRAGKREPEGGTVGSFLEGAAAAAPPPFEAKPPAVMRQTRLRVRRYSQGCDKYSLAASASDQEFQPPALPTPGLLRNVCL